jgi:lipopolysaccharide assembly protein B
MMLELLFLLLPVAAASGWYIAYYSFSHSQSHKKNDFNREYLLGLNYLLNEQSDKAVDTFIKILEVDTETVETHLALGVLFRRRGEIDRAIRLHQNLIVRPQLPRSQKIQALLALGQDYYYGGLLDRAERLFSEIATEANDDENSRIALRYLLEIYQQQKRWDIAILHAKKISKWDSTIIKNIAHYYCELALNHLKAKKPTEEVIRLLEKALKYDPNCVRSNLIKGELAISAGEWEKAIRIYQAIKNQDPDYITETLEPLSQCYLQRVGSGQADLLNYLYTTLSEYSKISICLAIVKLIQQEDREKALHFLTQQLQDQPSLFGLYHLVDLHCTESNTSTQGGNEKQNLTILKTLIAKLMKNKPGYRCLRCGFNSKILDWFCPACRNWSTIKPDRL